VMIRVGEVGTIESGSTVRDANRWRSLSFLCRISSNIFI
jgi:hypothetical protein